MKIITFIVLAISWMALVFQSYAVDKIILSAKLDGQSQVPANPSTAIGAGYIAVSSDMSTIRIRLTVGGFSSNISGIHIHDGAAGVSGPVLISLSAKKTQDTVITVDKATLGKLLSGNTYFNVHTASNPSGEIRGQIYVEQDYIFTAELSGSKEDPPVAGTAKGTAIVLLPKTLDKIYIWATTSELTGQITSCHLHKAPEGQNGGVVLDLTSLKSERHIVGNTSLNPTITMADLVAGNIYLNIHTTANSTGEIRGNFKWVKGLHFDTYLNSASVVPAPTSDAIGVATLWTSTDLDTLFYRVLLVSDKLTSQVTGAHIHNAIIGSNGPIAHNFTTNVTGDITGFWKASDAISFDLAALQKFLKQEMYIQIHTTLNANGELRGQCKPNARTGYLLNIDAQQAGSTATATGTGVASTNRYESHLSYLIAVEGLTGTIQSAHIHNAPRGSTGSTVNNITNSFTQLETFDVAVGNWTSVDATPFTTAQALNLKNDNLYVALHTQANPNGELRGQIENPVIQTGIEKLTLTDVLTVFPNPIHNYLSFSIENNVEDYFVSIKTIQGVTIFSEVQPLNGSINTQNFPSGLLILDIRDKNGNLVYVSKLLKQ